MTNTIPIILIVPIYHGIDMIKNELVRHTNCKHRNKMRHCDEKSLENWAADYCVYLTSCTTRLCVTIVPLALAT